ncbi:fimbria/pilus outer membrane usher protein [Pseudomonas fluorescens]|uniref:fimbria/pilus outer membrane usher protein n=1 Tax=Pseudomonas fluorescens TaxID=294 RepID=UPI0009BA1954|nr:fimbria/pilus outer membrane usher protein [Pseudomonas fluorescens]
MNAGKKYLSAVLLVGFFNYSQTCGAVDFNLDVMDIGDRNTIDLSRFKSANYVMPGQYLMSLQINDRKLPEQSLHFYALDQDETTTRACLPMVLVATFGLKSEALQKLGAWHSTQACMDLESLPGVRLKPDMSTSVLRITVPQAWMEYRDPNWAPISEWDQGIAGFLLDYSLNTSASQYSGSGKTTQIGTNGTMGFNAGPWRLRGDFQGSRYQGRNYQRQDFSWSSVYAYRPLPTLGAKLLLGETNLNSKLFDSFRFQGVNLASDDQMLPPSLRGYAPEVVGVAQGNARVTVRQGERVLYETAVPPGPFRIRDINSAVSGKLDVEITEDDGSTQKYQMETASVPYLSRPGYLRYNATVGRPTSYDREDTGPTFVTGELSWGLNSDWSLFGGGLLTDGYSAIAGGIGRNLHQFGVVSLDVTQTRARVPEQEQLTGHSWRVNYAKRFDDYDSEITFAGYRFSERNFMTMDEFLDARNHYLSGRNSKTAYTILANKSFTDMGFSTHMSYTHEDYWDGSATDYIGAHLSRYFDVGSFKGVSMTLSLNQARGQQESNNSLSLSISVPFGASQRVGYDTFLSQGKLRHAASYSKYNHASSYQLRANSGATGEGMQGYYSQRTSHGDYSFNGSYQSDGSQSLGLALQGGATVTAKGAALHPPTFNGGTRIMLDTEGVAGVPLQNGQVRTNTMGIAVLPAYTSYARTDVRIDVNRMADDMEASKSVTEATLTEGAIGYRRLTVIQGAKALVTLTLPDGSYPPFGASLQDASGREVAIIADSGFAYLSGIKADSRFQATWAGNQKCNVILPANLQSEQRYTLRCQPEN